MPRIRFETSDREVSFPDGDEVNLLRVAIRNECGIPFKCASGNCGTDRVRVLEGADRLIPQAEVARLVGKDRSTIANTLRLLKLPADVQELLAGKHLAEGHARALLAIDDQREISRLAQEAVEKGWSVREVEAVVRGETPEKARGKMMKKPPVPKSSSADARRVEDALRKRLGTDVRLTAKRRGRGLLAISYYSNDDLARLLELILGAPFEG